MEQFWEYFAVLAPSVGVFLIFWFLYRSVTRVDALERETEEEIRKEYEQNKAAQESKNDSAENNS